MKYLFCLSFLVLSLSASLSFAAKMDCTIGSKDPYSPGPVEYGRDYKAVSELKTTDTFGIQVVATLDQEGVLHLNLAGCDQSNCGQTWSDLPMVVGKALKIHSRLTNRSIPATYLECTRTE